MRVRTCTCARRRIYGHRFQVLLPACTPGTVGGILISNTAAHFDVDADTMFLASQAGNRCALTGHNDLAAPHSLRIVTG